MRSWTTRHLMFCAVIIALASKVPSWFTYKLAPFDRRIKSISWSKITTSDLSQANCNSVDVSAEKTNWVMHSF